MPSTIGILGSILAPFFIKGACFCLKSPDFLFFFIFFVQNEKGREVVWRKGIDENAEKTKKFDANFFTLSPGRGKQEIFGKRFAGRKYARR